YPGGSIDTCAGPYRRHEVFTVDVTGFGDIEVRAIKLSAYCSRVTVQCPRAAGNIITPQIAKTPHIRTSRPAGSFSAKQPEAAIFAHPGHRLGTTRGTIGGPGDIDLVR